MRGKERPRPKRLSPLPSNLCSPQRFPPLCYEHGIFGLTATSRATATFRSIRYLIFWYLAKDLSDNFHEIVGKFIGPKSVSIIVYFLHVVHGTVLGNSMHGIIHEFYF